MSFTDTPDFNTSVVGRDNSIPRFYVEPLQNIAKSNMEGRPIFDDREMVEINVPGDLKNVVCTFVTDLHRQRWPQYYAAFKAGLEAPSSGTSLMEWPQVTRSQAEELKYFKVHTVEQLAEMPDDLLTKVAPMNGKIIREKAQRTLQVAAGAAPAEKLAAELAQRDSTIDELKAGMKALQDEVARLQASQDETPNLPIGKKGAQS